MNSDFIRMLFSFCLILGLDELENANILIIESLNFEDPCKTSLAKFINHFVVL